MGGRVGRCGVCGGKKIKKSPYINLVSEGILVLCIYSTVAWNWNIAEALRNNQNVASGVITQVFSLKKYILQIQNYFFSTSIISRSLASAIPMHFPCLASMLFQNKLFSSLVFF